MTRGKLVEIMSVLSNDVNQLVKVVMILQPRLFE